MSESVFSTIRTYLLIPPAVTGECLLAHLTWYLIRPLFTEGPGFPEEGPACTMIAERVWNLPGDLLSESALPLTAAGLFLIIPGIIIAALALTPFVRYRINPHPLSRTPHRLFTDGIYRRSRNPMYLSHFFLLFGWGLVFSPELLPLTVIWIGYFLKRQILMEEEFLEETCPEYRDYLKRTPRCFGIRNS